MHLPPVLEEARAHMQRFVELVLPPDLSVLEDDISGWRQALGCADFWDAALEDVGGLDEIADLEGEDALDADVYHTMWSVLIGDALRRNVVHAVDWKDGESFLAFVQDSVGYWGGTLNWQSASIEQLGQRVEVSDPFEEGVYETFDIEQLTDWVHVCLQRSGLDLCLWFWNDYSDSYIFWLAPSAHEGAFVQLAEETGLEFHHGGTDFDPDVADAANPAWVAAVEELIPLISAKPKIQERTLADFRRATVESAEYMDTGLNILDFLSVRAGGVLQRDVVWEGNVMYKKWLDLACAQWGLGSALTESDVQTSAMPDLIEKVREHLQRNGLVYWTVDDDLSQGRVWISKAEDREAVRAIGRRLEVAFSDTPVEWSAHDLKRFAKREQRLRAAGG